MKQQLSKNDIWQLTEKLKRDLGKTDLISTKDRVELVDGTIYLVNNSPRYFKQGERILPVLRFCLEQPELLRTVTVDMGAIPFITKGADVMRPGVMHIDEEIKKDEFIIVADEKHHKALCIGQAMMNGKDMKSAEKGVVIKNWHYVGDRIWNM